ncbi:MAG TPA: RDD family protein [Candidatus Binatia bacterium]|nr:RDD family protein [Candidatus Binatia bacterium]
MSAQPPEMTPPGQPQYPQQAGGAGPGGYPSYPGYPGYPGPPYPAYSSYPGYRDYSLQHYAFPRPPGPAQGLEYATFWRRFGGYLLDGVVVGIPYSVALGFLVFPSLINYVNQQVANAQGGATTVGPITVPTSLAQIVPLTNLLVAAAVGVVLYALYFGVLVSAWGRTVGQAAVGVSVVREENAAAPLPIGRALVRSVIWWAVPAVVFLPYIGDLISLVVLLALLWVAWDPRKQGLHDKLGHAFVVRRAPVLPALGYGPVPYPYAQPGPPPPWRP